MNEKLTKSENEMINKVYGAIFGFVIADAIGVPVEFVNREKLVMNPIIDMIGFGTHNQPLGTWSDDSSMTIATIDSINENDRIDCDDIMYKFCMWYKNSEYTATGKLFDIGITTLESINRYMKNHDVIDCGGRGIRDNGNGSLMRIMPIVLYSYYRNIDEVEEIKLINNVSSLTHAHEISRLGCKIYCDYMKRLLNGENKLDAYHALCNTDYSKNYSNESIVYYKRILDGKLENLKDNEVDSSAFVVSTLEASIWSNLNSNSYEECVLKAVNLGNDTDTIGAIAGSMAGIIYGYDSIPQKWKDKLISYDYLKDLCDRFCIKLNVNTEKFENGVYK